MAKRNRKLSYEQKIKQGRGTGSGIDYKPWIQIQDFGYRGRTSRGVGIKTGRLHGFLSDLECNYYYYLDISENVMDIREQYPLLPIEETILIANEICGGYSYELLHILGSRLLVARGKTRKGLSA